MEKLSHQLWYLSEEMLILAFFDTGVLLSEMAIVVALEKESHEDRVKRPLLDLRDLEQRTFASFVSSRVSHKI